MDAVRVAVLREVLTGTGWVEATRSFAGALRGSLASRGAGGLLLVGTETYEPWHLAAHLDDEAAWNGLPGLAPALVRFRVPPGAPPHLAVGPRRLEAIRRGETVLVVAPDRPGPALLERVHGARRAGATVLAMDTGDPDLRTLAHDTLTVPADPDAEVGMDVLQHLLSAALGETGPPGPRVGRGPGRRFRDRLSRLADQLAASPPPARW